MELYFENNFFFLVEGFALYLFQLLTLTTRVKNNWKSRISKLHLNKDMQEIVCILQSCLDAEKRLTASQLVENLESIQKAQSKDI